MSILPTKMLKMIFPHDFQQNASRRFQEETKIKSFSWHKNENYVISRQRSKGSDTKCKKSLKPTCISKLL